MAATLPPGLWSPASAGNDEPGRQIFTTRAQPACGACHTLSDAGSAAEVGPSLDELRPDAERVAKAVREGVGVMPPYRGKLDDEEIRAVADYVARVAGGAS
jgi:mono/diheme cytochrome c family protein